MRALTAAICFILTLGVIPRTWATVPVDYKCQILLMASPALRAEAQRLFAEGQTTSDAEVIQLNAHKLHEIARILTNRNESEHTKGIRELDEQARVLVQRIAQIQSFYPVALATEPLITLSTEAVGGADFVISKVEARVFGAYRMDDKNTLAAYATELTIHIKEPYRAYFSENFHARGFFSQPSAFENENEMNRFKDMISGLAMVDRDQIHSGVRQGIFKAWVYNQPTDGGLIQTVSATEMKRIDPFTAIGFMDFEMAIEQDFYPDDQAPFGSLIVETIFELAKIELGDLLKRIKDQPL